ncbi:hypothetical protein [Candidatus Nitrospira bockiana]
MKRVPVLLTLCLLVLMAACEKGHYTGERHYIGNPERVPQASEPVHQQDPMQDPMQPEPKDQR